MILASRKALHYSNRVAEILHFSGMQGLSAYERAANQGIWDFILRFFASSKQYPVVIF
jgi:hypothetical protein